MKTTEFFQTALAEFDRRVEHVGAGQWQDRTPCSDWDVRALVQHAVGECRWVPPMLEGRTIAEVGDALVGDLLGDEPAAAWRAASVAALRAASEPGVLLRTVHLSFGDRVADEYISQVACDLTIHAWDLARAVGDDERLDPALVDAAHTTIHMMEPGIDEWRAAGLFGPAVEPPAGADRQARLIALVGRRP